MSLASMGSWCLPQTIIGYSFNLLPLDIRIHSRETPWSKQQQFLLDIRKSATDNISIAWREERSHLGLSV